MHTTAKWELDLKGITNEIEINGKENGIDVTDKQKINNIAEKVIDNPYYIKEISKLEFSEQDNKLTRYYDILWKTIDNILNRGEIDFIGGTEQVPLTADLLNLIIMVQRYKHFQIAKGMYDEYRGEKKQDWYKETENFFNSLDSEVLAKHKLSKNILSFEKVLDYKVTAEMTATLSNDLPLNFRF